MRENPQFWILIVKISLDPRSDIAYFQHLANDIITLECSLPGLTGFSIGYFVNKLQLFQLNVAMPR